MDGIGKLVVICAKATIISLLSLMYNGTLCMACNYEADHFSITRCGKKPIAACNLLKSLDHLQIVKSDWLKYGIIKALHNT